MLAVTRYKGKPTSSLATFLLPVVFATVAWAGQDDEALSRDMPERVLRSHHFRITEQGAIAALGSDNSQVRECAALVLLNHWPADAASPIEVAMLKESDEFSRVHMASDLAKLGDNAGREMLVSECHSIGEWGSTRMLAARFMSELHEDTCVDSVLELLQSDSDPQDTMSKVEAVDLVPTFIGRLAGQDSQLVLELVAKALDDPDLGVRLTASNMLVSLGDVSAISRLRAAFEKEQDENIKSAMLSDVKSLEEQRRRLRSSRKLENAAP
jgi:HEAT repeat protein